jgi:hypothetical protein
MFNINPSEFWQMSMIEILKLLEDETNKDVDVSLMLNFEREMNGASKEWLQKV